MRRVVIAMGLGCVGDLIYGLLIMYQLPIQFSVDAKEYIRLSERAGHEFNQRTSKTTQKSSVTKALNDEPQTKGSAP